MDAKKVEILLEAVESGSMMGIAGQNGYTPSGLSHLLRRLEAELGVQLVERTNRGIALSENGKRLLPYLRGYVESFETLEREAALLRNETETTLRLGAYASIAKNWMPATAACFRQSVSTDSGGTGGSQQAGAVSRDERGQTAFDLCV